MSLSCRENRYIDLISPSNKMNAPPIYTMPLPGQKMYVITKPDLIQTVQKQHKALAFEPIAAKFSTIVCGVTEATRAKVLQNIYGDEPGPSLYEDSHVAMYGALKPGPDLDDMNRSMIHEVASALDALGTEPRTINLNHYLRDMVTTATTRSVYGPLNPFDDKSISSAFWDFESGFMAIVANILPSLLARKPVAAREKVANAFIKYYQSGGVEQASVLARNRYTASITNHVPLQDLSRFEVGGSIAILVNTTPAVFWTLFLLHAHPGLRDSIRAEIDACTETSTTPSNKTLKTISITTLKEECPLLLSAYQETLRYCAIGTSVRQVVEDTYLSTYLLKKGAMLQMPSRVIHTDASLWGPSVSEFNPRRFLASEKANRPKDTAFRSFGGGKTLCPGRHFATNEVLAVVAVFIARFDMEPVDGEKGWEMPTCANTNVAAVVMEPDTDIGVRIEGREGFESVEWGVRLDSAGDKVFAMVTEDLGGE